MGQGGITRPPFLGSLHPMLVPFRPLPCWSSSFRHLGKSQRGQQLLAQGQAAEEPLLMLLLGSGMGPLCSVEAAGLRISSGHEIRLKAQGLPFRIGLLIGNLFPVQVNSEPSFRLGPERRGGKGGQGTPMSSDSVLVSIKEWELDEQSNIQT